MWDVDKTFARVDEALSNGELWRAKEILQGCIATKAYTPALYERYGQLLLQMGDTVEAGRHLFLSGVRRPEYEEAIALFCTKHGNVSPEQLYASFPRRAKLARIEEYPDALAEDLRAVGLPDDLPLPLAGDQRNGGTEIGGWLAFIVFALLVVCVIVGFIAVVRWLIDFITG